MPRAPGVLTIIGGGGAEMVAAATWKLLGPCRAAMTFGPDASGPDGDTAASGAMAARTAAGVSGNSEGAAPTAPANTRGVITAMPNAGERVDRRARCCTASAGSARRRPPMRTRPSLSLSAFGKLLRNCCFYVFISSLFRCLVN